MRLVEQVEFAQAFSFKYSPRPGTPASNQRKQVKDEVKGERLARLQALLNRQADDVQSTDRRRQRLCRAFGTAEGRHPGQLVGKSPYLQAVHVETARDAGIGDLIDVEIVAHHAHSLGGRPTADAALQCRKRLAAALAEHPTLERHA